MINKATNDRLFSQYIRKRDQMCVACRRAWNLQCAHIFGRRFLSTRWDEDNAVTLCHTCHRRYTDHPKDWETFCRKRMGDGPYEELRRKAKTGRPPDPDEVKAELKRKLTGEVI